MEWKAEDLSNQLKSAGGCVENISHQHYKRKGEEDSSLHHSGGWARVEATLASQVSAHPSAPSVTQKVGFGVARGTPFSTHLSVRKLHPCLRPQRSGWATE